MGIQIVVEKDDLAKAGVDMKVLKRFDDEWGEWVEERWLAVSMDGRVWHSHMEDALMVDANHWGENRTPLLESLNKRGIPYREVRGD